MKRDDFIKVCAAGVCGPGALGFHTSLPAPTDSGDGQTPSDPVDDEPSKQQDELLRRQLEFTRARFADLMSLMQEHVDRATRDKMLLTLGHQCAQDYLPLFQRYRGDLQGFLDTIKTRWADRTEYDETTGTLRVIGKIRPCVCPLVEVGRTPTDFCTCTCGWNQFAFSTVLGKPVTVELEESVLRGAARCTHRIIGV